MDWLLDYCEDLQRRYQKACDDNDWAEQDKVKSYIQDTMYEDAQFFIDAARERDALQKRVMKLSDEIQVALSWAHTYKTIYDLAGEIQRILNADSRAEWRRAAVAARAATAPDADPSSRA